MLTSQDLRLTLLQARRPADPAREDECRGFAARLGIDVASLQTVDLLTQELGNAVLDDTDVLLVGGAGHFSVLDEHAGIQRFITFLAQSAESGVPIFASCFGFQALVLGLGGQVIADPDHAEVGSYELKVTDAAREDPLFGSLPSPFLAQLGHTDRASKLPSSLVNFAYSERTPYQAIHLVDKPVYATQFHPELTYLENKKRFETYMEEYGRFFGEEEAQRRLDSHRPSPHASDLLRRFVAEIVPAYFQENA